MNGHQNEAFSCLIGALNSPRKVNGYGADYAAGAKVQHFFEISKFYKALVINYLDVWHTFCCFGVWEEKCSIFMFQVLFLVWSDLFKKEYIESFFQEKVPSMHYSQSL